MQVRGRLQRWCFLLLADHLELRDRLEILRSAGHSPRGDQRVEGEEGISGTKQIELDRIGADGREGTCASQLSHEVDRADCRGEFEVEPSFQRLLVEAERESRTAIAKVSL